MAAKNLKYRPAQIAVSQKTKNLLITLIIFSTALTGILMIRNIVEKNMIRESRERAGYMTQALASSLEKNLESDMYPMDVWDLLIRNGKGRVKDFGSICDNLNMNREVVEQIELAPGGIVAYRYPMTESSQERINVQQDFVVRKAVYVTDQRGQQSFWGLVILHLNAGGIMQSAHLDRLISENYEYKLWKKDILSGKPEILSSSTGAELENPVSAEIEVPEGENWVLSVAQKDGWIPQSLVVRHAFLSVMMCTLLSMVVWLMLSLKLKEQELMQLSYQDSLTSLNNPRKYISMLEEFQKDHLAYGLIYIDMNDFKHMNDTYGHQMGDALLNVLAKRLEKCIGDGAYAFRVGGDEFAVLVRGAHESGYYEELIGRIAAESAREIQIGKLSLKISTSAGYARCPEDAFRFEDIIRKADNVMYEQKKRYKQKEN
ncbi:MAG: GGDEF domain-containing protein [Butyrivibrio sp.]|nr:GGDEF domain-containing protein [Butyrivibrio sp.]